MVEGEKVTLVATVLPAEAAKQVSWSSSNSQVASVATGVVSALSEGSVTITAQAGDKTASCQVNVKSQFALEREVLLDVYQSLGGDQWDDNSGWCTDRPFSEWYGITTHDDGHVMDIMLHGNNMKGVIPASIGKLTRLRQLEITGSDGITGEIPPEIGQLSHLRWLQIHRTSISGTIPEELSNLQSLNFLILSNNPSLGGPIPAFLGKMKSLWGVSLNGCHFTGSLPVELMELEELKSFNCYENPLSGKVPAAFSSWPLWSRQWGYMIWDTELDISEAMPQCPAFSVTASDGTVLTSDLFSSNELTVLFYWDIHDKVSPTIIPYVVSAFNLFNQQGLGVIGCTLMEDSVIEQASESYGIPWPTFIVSDDNNIGNNTDQHGYYPVWGTCISIFDKDGTLVFSNLNSEELYQSFVTFVANWFHSDWDGEYVGDNYESTDYSMDGTVTVLQTATEGAGIDIVLMGDAFSDRLIADATYETQMVQAMENFFSEEPFTSLRNMFNVSMVTVVSKNEKYFNGSQTALSASISGGNNGKVMEYVHKAVSPDKDTDVLPIVILNSFESGGICAVYGVPEGYTGDWGSGLGISYVALGGPRITICHEAGGHGFAKLEDEYCKYFGAIPEEDKEYYKAYARYGFWKNVDYENDPSKIKWATFLSDDRYVSEELGIYEGALYEFGLYKATEMSIMFNSGHFNAPSREAIWYRAHKLAYGADWEYHYEDFVAWDMAHSYYSTTSQTKANFVEAPITCTRPVVFKESWDVVSRK